MPRRPPPQSARPGRELRAVAVDRDRAGAARPRRPAEEREPRSRRTTRRRDRRLTLAHRRGPLGVTDSCSGRRAWSVTSRLGRTSARAPSRAAIPSRRIAPTPSNRSSAGSASRPSRAASGASGRAGEASAGPGANGRRRSARRADGARAGTRAARVGRPQARDRNRDEGNAEQPEKAEPGECDLDRTRGRRRASAHAFAISPACGSSAVPACSGRRRPPQAARPIPKGIAKLAVGPRRVNEMGRCDF